MNTERSNVPTALFGGLAGFIIGVVATLVTGVAVWFFQGGPVSNEWVCSRGEFPISNTCLPYGERVSDGETAYPNGPLDEDERP